MPNIVGLATVTIEADIAVPEGSCWTENTQGASQRTATAAEQPGRVTGTRVGRRETWQHAAAGGRAIDFFALIFLPRASNQYLGDFHLLAGKAAKSSIP